MALAPRSVAWLNVRRTLAPTFENCALMRVGGVGSVGALVGAFDGRPVSVGALVGAALGAAVPAVVTGHAVDASSPAPKQQQMRFAHRYELEHVDEPSVMYVQSF